jgi:hypothetical protein
MAKVNQQINLKIIINERFSIRVLATRADVPHDFQGRVLVLDVTKDALSNMIRDGSECEINIAGSKPHYGRVQAVRESGNGSDYMTVWVALQGQLIQEKIP